MVGADPKELAEAIAEILDNKKGKDVKIIAVGDKTIIADYFVLANGNTNTHVRALADEVEFQLKEQLGVSPDHIEGAGGNSWTLLDYGCVIINIFTAQAREFYKLERLWNGTEIRVSEENEENE